MKSKSDEIRVRNETTSNNNTAHQSVLSKNKTDEIIRDCFRAKKPNLSKFYRWLKQQRKRNDPVSDFAIDVYRDRSFPKHSSSRKKILEFLESVGACDGAIDAFHEAHAEFSGQKVNQKNKKGDIND